jgi:hypothetical protein
MATLATVLAFSRAQSQTDSNGLTNANGIIFANEALVDFRRRLQSAGIDASQTQESYTSIVANQGTYLYPTDMFRLKTIELNFTDQNVSNYLPATQVDVANLPGGVSFSWLRTSASTAAPQWDDRGDQYEIFPTPLTSNANGIRMFYYLEATEYTATGDTIAYPESLDYRIIGWRISYLYLKSLGKIDIANDYLREYEERVKQLIASLGQGSQSPIQVQVMTPFYNGWQL